ncbi:aldehyde dehydrogenase family protein [Streptosporangium sp. G11]|uniref:aldehyde dehydrogenase family protein n=1 Tax=Streptosporangium sp. G11 TaxID=3436926 RepID=UPI003EB7213F
MHRRDRGELRALSDRPHGEGAGGGPGVRWDARPFRVRPHRRHGRRAAGRAARGGTLEKVYLELGGNDALIVCDDADVEEAARAVVTWKS